MLEFQKTQTSLKKPIFSFILFEIGLVLINF